MKTPQRGLTPVIAGVGVGISCALAAVIGLVTFSRPADFETRLTKVEADAAAAAGILRQRNGSPALPADGACPSASPEQVQKLREELNRIAQAFRLEQVGVEVAPDLAASTSGRLAALRVRFEGSGQYDAALGALGRLESVRPLIFVDRADLISKTSLVSLGISGRVYCSAL